MPKASEQEVLKRTVDKLKKAKGDSDKIEAALKELEKKLPEGEIKDFFQEVDKILAPVEEIIEEEDEDRIDEALKALRAAKAKFKKGEAPEGIPSEIVKAYRDILGATILGCKMLKGLSELFE